MKLDENKCETCGRMASTDLCSECDSDRAWKLPGVAGWGLWAESLGAKDGRRSQRTRDELAMEEDLLRADDRIRELEAQLAALRGSSAAAKEAAEKADEERKQLAKLTRRLRKDLEEIGPLREKLGAAGAEFDELVNQLIADAGEASQLIPASPEALP